MFRYTLVCYYFLLLLSLEGKSLKFSSTDKKPFELDEFLYGSFYTKKFNGTWMTGDTFIYSKNDDIYIFNTISKNSTVFLEKSVLTDYSGASITVSPDQLFVLIRYSVQAVFRHSATALYVIYDVDKKVYYDIADKQPVQLATWSPVGHGLVYVHKNNIYYLDNPTSSPKAVTSSGVEGVIYNGIPDWVYEEEVLGSGSALWFSPNGKQIVFASFDDSEVKEFLYVMYGKPGDLQDQYPQEVKIRYPKVNTENPTVKTYLANLETDKESIQPVEINTTSGRFLTQNYILYDVTWITDEEFAVIYTNRIQNKGELVRCNKNTVDCHLEKDYEEKNGWLNPLIPKYNKDGIQKIEILPQTEGNDRYYHIVITKDGVSKRLTKGSFEVLSIYGWNENDNVVYFLGTRENQPSQQHVYMVNIDSTETICLTCEMTTPEGVGCKYASASFSKDLSYYAKICEGPGPYLTEIHSNHDSNYFFEWENNQELRNKLASKLLPKIEDLQVPVANGFIANVRLFLPPNLDKNSSKKYPAIVNVYAGPGTNRIQDAYSSGLENYIVTNREYIYIYIDGRGSGKGGLNKMFQIYYKFGTVEVEDQINVTRYLQENFPYIDAQNTGIWGWSYGGFVAAWALVKDKANVFKFGLSVAPVTNFIYYDSIYTERYMGLASQDDNLAGYNNTDLTRQVEGFKNKLFFLIHGNADDNVHYQQSMLLSKALEYADIPFRQQSYPDENHGLGHVSAHLYHTIDDFWASSIGEPKKETSSVTSINKFQSLILLVPVLKFI